MVVFMSTIWSLLSGIRLPTRLRLLVLSLLFSLDSGHFVIKPSQQRQRSTYLYFSLQSIIVLQRITKLPQTRRLPAILQLSTDDLGSSRPQNMYEGRQHIFLEQTSERKEIRGHMLG